MKLSTLFLTSTLTLGTAMLPSTTLEARGTSGAAGVQTTILNAAAGATTTTENGLKQKNYRQDFTK